MSKSDFHLSTEHFHYDRNALGPGYLHGLLGKWALKISAQRGRTLCRPKPGLLRLRIDYAIGSTVKPEEESEQRRDRRLVILFVSFSRKAQRYSRKMQSPEDIRNLPIDITFSRLGGNETFLFLSLLSHLYFRHAESGKFSKFERNRT